jgi:hypothetical protein
MGFVDSAYDEYSILSIKSENYIGSRVRISGSMLKWAEGREGIIQMSLMMERGPMDDPLADAHDYLLFTVKLDDMDPNKPPFGLVTVKFSEVEFITEEEKTEEKKTLSRDEVVHKLTDLKLREVLSEDFNQALENAANYMIQDTMNHDWIRNVLQDLERNESIVDPERHKNLVSIIKYLGGETK